MENAYRFKYLSSAPGRLLALVLLPQGYFRAHAREALPLPAPALYLALADVPAQADGTNRVVRRVEVR